MKCEDCGAPSNTTWGAYGNARLCHDCADKRKRAMVIEKSKTLTTCSDFQKWDSGDMSELFWVHLGRYVKNPNQESLNMMSMAYRWACHSSHGIANSFHHALKWAGIDLWDEEEKWREQNARIQEESSFR